MMYRFERRIQGIEYGYVEADNDVAANVILQSIEGPVNNRGDVTNFEAHSVMEVVSLERAPELEEEE